MGKGSSKGHTPREAKDNLKSTQLLSVIRRGRWSGCGDWSLRQNVLCETASGRFCRLWSVRN
ncbi:hypothetical protein, partial [Escherichia coli]|uniref:hypothetical protein n=1 Tax=Escherichia coli TaxID=562 RepID=UPI001BC8AA56